MFNTQPVAGIIQYLLQTYDPRAIIITGSYADGTFDAYSDLDAYLIGYDGCRNVEDYSIINDVQLQAQLSPWPFFEKMPLSMQAIFKGAVIVYDPEGCGRRFMDMVDANLSCYPCASKRQKKEHLILLNGLLCRQPRRDADSDLRGHVLLQESLRIWTDFSDRIMQGSRKTLSMMKKTDPDGYVLYCRALRSFEYEDMCAWTEHLHRLYEINSGREFRINN